MTKQPCRHSTTEVPNIFLTVAYFHLENFPWPISQSVAVLQYSNILPPVKWKRSQKKEAFAPEEAVFCAFSSDLKKKVITPNTSTFCKISYDFKEKGSHRANTTFSNQIALWPTAKCCHGPQVENYCCSRCPKVSYC